jgi:hypothetical protein
MGELAVARALGPAGSTHLHIYLAALGEATTSLPLERKCDIGTSGGTSGIRNCDRVQL